MYALKHEYAQTSRNEERSVIASSVEIWSVCRTSDHGRAVAVSGEDDWEELTEKTTKYLSTSCHLSPL